METQTIVYCILGLLTLMMAVCGIALMEWSIAFKCLATAALFATAAVVYATARLLMDDKESE